MSALKKKAPEQTLGSRISAAKQEQLRLHKVEAERIKEFLTRRILDNPTFAKKAAVLITGWISQPRKNSQKETE